MGQWIWDEYDTARTAFRTAASRQGAHLIREILPSYVGPAGETLSMDAAYLGPKAPTRLLLVLSGVHGFEGPAGSAVQAKVLEHGIDLSVDMGALVIHAVNPYGYAHWSRSTEDNVDLNRAFVDRNQPLPTNPDYADFHPYFCPDELNDRSLNAARMFIESYEAEHGADRASSAIGAGQYDWPNGLYYGGREEPWSVSALYSLICRSLSREALTGVALVDFHTGRGDFGAPFFLNFDRPGSEEFEQAAEWWGRENLLRKDELGSKYQNIGPPPRHGLVLRGVRRFFAPATLAGCVVEFGTFDLWTMYRAELADRWVRFRGHRSRQLSDELRLEAFRAFNPDDEEWRKSVLDRGPRIVSQAARGLRNWQVPVVA